MKDIVALLLFALPIWLTWRAVRGTSGKTDFAGDLVDDNRFWTLFWNAFRLRCPVCKRGGIAKNWLEIHDECPICGVRFRRDSGYFLGPIYFNYGATGVLMFGLYFTLHDACGVPFTTAMSIAVAFGFLFPVFFFRYGWASWLVFDQFFDPRRPVKAMDADA